jgi:hypothetical protein
MLPATYINRPLSENKGGSQEKNICVNTKKRISMTSARANKALTLLLSKKKKTKNGSFSGDLEAAFRI